MVCTRCPSNTRIPPDIVVAGSADVCKCVAGFYHGPGGACFPAPRGFFTATYGLSAPTACPTGSVAPSAGSSSCSPCPQNAASLSGVDCACFAGYSGVLSGADGVCDDCAANFYQPSSGNTSSVCIPCRPNSVTPPGITAVADPASCLCRAGFYTLPNGVCEPAPPVRARRSGRARSHFLSPVTPWLKESPDLIALHAQGHFVAGRGMTAFAPCQTGTVAPGFGTPACSQCPDFSSAISTVACACRAGHSGTLAGAQVRSECPARVFAIDANLSVLRIEEQQTAQQQRAVPARRMLCVLDEATAACERGHAGKQHGPHLHRAQGSCTVCPANFYQPFGNLTSVSCLACPPFMITSADNLGATDVSQCSCAPGFYVLPDGTCAAVPKARFHARCRRHRFCGADLRRKRAAAGATWSPLLTSSFQ